MNYSRDCPKGTCSDDQLHCEPTHRPTFQNLTNIPSSIGRVLKRAAPPPRSLPDTDSIFGQSLLSPVQETSSSSVANWPQTCNVPVTLFRRRHHWKSSSVNSSTP